MASYDQLVNSGGTVFNQGAKVAYQNPDQLAADLGTTASGIQWGKIAQAGSGFNPSGYSGYTPPNPSTPVPGSQIVNGSGLNFPPAPPVDNGSSLVQGVIAGQNYSNPPPVDGSQTPGLDKATTDYNSSLGDYKSLIAKTPDESTMLKNAENAAGTPGMKSQIDQLKTDLATTTAAYNNQYQNIGAKGVESGTPAVFYQGEQAAQQRQASVIIAGKSAVLAALQGNYTEAENLAKQTADMQFKAAEDKIKNQLDFVKLNQDTMTKAQANSMKDKAAEQKADLVVQKANVTTALSSGVQTTFWTKPNGTVVRTNDGKEYSTPAEAFADGVLPDFSNAPKINPVGKSETRKIGSTTYHITYDQAGNVLSKTALSGSSTGTGTGTTKTTLKQDVQSMNSQLTTRKGQDGYISPQDYKTALTAWQKAGYSAANFKTNFGNLINPADKKDYQ